MKKALHPNRNDKITVPEHINEFGNDPLESWEEAMCPVCKRRLKNVAPSSVNSIGHFAHKKNSGYCPTKAKAAAPYCGLPPRNPDPAAAVRIKTAFLANWQKHYSRLNWIVKGLAVDEFTSIITIANKERIWEYSQLEEFQLPYVFATLADFPQSRSFKGKDGTPVRKKWFRCWFDATVQRYDDLWIHRETPLLFWRAWYDLPSVKRKPSSEDLIDSYEMELSADFLKDEKLLNPYVVKTISDWLNRHF